MENPNYIFLIRLLEYSKEYEEETKDLPFRAKTRENFVHWIFNKIANKREIL